VFSIVVGQTRRRTTPAWEPAGVHPRIGKVFIEGDDDGEIALRPLEDCVVRGAL
jgi:hypothetical protein